MTMIAVRFNMTEMFTDRDFTMVKNPGKGDMEDHREEGERECAIQGERRRADGSAGGKRVGVAYQLPSGEVIYVPDR